MPVSFDAMMRYINSVGRKLARVVSRARGDMRTPWQRFLGRFELLLVDHGFIRALYSNRHQVAPGMYRSAQPSPAHVKQMADLGVKTIVNLRGEGDTGAYLLEAEACRRFGIELVNFPVSSKRAPPRETLLAAARMFQELNYPALMHCKSGADRAGLMSAVYLAMHEGRDADQAAAQLRLRYGHLRIGRTGVLDEIFRQYRRDAAETPMDFSTWVEQVYDADKINLQYRSGRLGNLLVDRILRRE